MVRSVYVKISKVKHIVNVTMEFISIILHVEIHAEISPVVLVLARQIAMRLINPIVRVQSTVRETDASFREMSAERNLDAVAAFASQTIAQRAALHVCAKVVASKLIHARFLPTVPFKIVEPKVFVCKLTISSLVLAPYLSPTFVNV